MDKCITLHFFTHFLSKFAIIDIILRYKYQYWHLLLNEEQCMIVVLKRKTVSWVLLLLVVVQLALTAVLCSKLFSDQNTSLVDLTVVIDAGHGGVDGGVVAGNGVKESDLNLEYAKTLGEYFKRSGFNVVYTRKTREGLYGLATNGFKMRDMLKRKEIICNAKPNFVISVHMNKFAQRSRNGPQVFYQENSEMGQKLAESLQTVFNNFTGNKHEAICGDFFICRESPCTAVIVECGFLSNDAEAEKLQTQSYREEICAKIFDGVMLFLYSA